MLTTFFFQIFIVAMSNQGYNDVPVLNGTNWREFSPLFEAFAMTRNFLGILLGTKPKPTLAADGSNKDEVDNWDELDMGARGFLRLKILGSFSHYVENKTSYEAYKALKDAFSVVGPAVVFSDFRALLNTQITGNENPLPAIEEMRMLHSRLSMNGVTLDEFVKGMLLVNAIPQKWETVATVIMQGKKADITFDKVAPMIASRWEQLANAQQSNKISAIKKKRDRPDPSFKSQHKPAPAVSGGTSNGNSGETKKRRKRGGKDKGKAKEKNTPHSHTIISAATLPLSQRLTPALPVPLTARIAEISPSGITSRVQRSASATFTYGEPNQHPRLVKALELAARMEVPRTQQTVANLMEILPDPRVASSSKKTLDWADDVERFSKRSKVSDDEEDAVSLGDDDSDFEEELAYYAGIDNEQVPSLLLHTLNATDDIVDLTDATTRLRLLRDSMYDNLNVESQCHHLLSYSSCAKCKGKAPPQSTVKIPKTFGDNDWSKHNWWLMDSGASIHCTSEMSDFIEYENLILPIPVKTASGYASLTGVGAVVIRHPILQADGSHSTNVTRLWPVYYHKLLDGRLLSMGSFIHDGMVVRGDKLHIGIYQPNDPTPTIDCFPRRPNDTLYVVPDYSSDKRTFTVNPVLFAVDYETMHRRLGHPGKGVLKHAKSRTKGFPKDVTIPEETPICPGCAEGKQKSIAFPPSQTRAKKPFEKIHSDLKSLPVESYHRNRYFIIFYDDSTSHGWIIFLKNKSDALSATRQFIAMVKTQFDASIKEWMSDAGGEYKSDEFLKMLADLGIKVLQSAPHQHQQNGRAERWIQTIMDKAQPMRIEACLPPSWWEFAVAHAVHVYNRTPIRRLDWMTPYEALTGEVPDISHLRVFGCGAYVYLPEEVRPNKLSPKSELMIYLGVAEGVKGHKFMRLPNNVIFIGVTAIFDEEMFPKCPDQRRRHSTRAGQDRSLPRDSSDPPHNPEVDDDDSDDDAPPAPHPRYRPPPPPPKGKEPARDDAQDGDPEPYPDPPNMPPAEPAAENQPRRSGRVRKPPAKPDNVYGEHRNPTDIIRDVENKRKWKELVGEKPSRSRKAPQEALDKVPGPSRAQDPPPPPPEATPSEDEVERELARLCREGGVELLDFLLLKALPNSELLPNSPNPREWSFKDILKLPSKEREEWMTACREELDALRKRKVFALTELPSGRKALKGRWVFDLKTDGRKKARLVAKGFSQIEGIDFDQIFSPVVRFETVRMILALAALEGWHISGLDVKSAYLYGKLDEEIYMEQPEGFKVEGLEHLVLRLLRAIYGLKQAGLAWWKALSKSMEELGFTRLSSDAGIFIYRKDGALVVVIVYVDDCLFCGKDKALVAKLKANFMKRWECRDLGETKEFLRMRIIQKAQSIHLDQTAYLEKVLQRFGMQNARIATTPLPAGYKPNVNTDEVSPQLRQRFQTVIGSLLYIMLGTRPDIAFAVTMLAQFSANPSQEHLDKALYICRYLLGTKNYALIYDGKSQLGLIACVDADWAADPIKRRSVTGYYLKLANGIISWQSRAQSSVALSSTDAEYMALSDCSRQVVWFRSLFEELGYQLGPIPICGDNQGAIFTASNPVQNRRTKHIEVRYHFIRDLITQGKIEVFYIEGSENPADMFTKNLGHVKFLKFRQQLGLEFYSP